MLLGFAGMGPTEKLGRDQVFHLLRSPVRRGIIRLLGEESELSFTELRRSFPAISVGTLYYHLDLLERIVDQNSEKKYVLTEEGRRVLAEILRSEEAMIPVKASVQAQSGADTPVSFLLMRRLFSDISLRPVKYVASPFVACLSLALLAWASSSIQLLFFFVSVSAAPAFLYAVLAAVSLMGVYSLLNGLSYIFFRRSDGNLALLIATSVGFIPLMIYPLALFLSSVMIGQASFALSHLDIALTIISQGLAVLLISEGLSQAKGLRLERAALITLAAVFLNMLLLYFMGYVEV